jgi:DNA-damage-inducible protein J
MKAQNDVQLTFRLDKNLKEDAENLFNRLGMNMTTALNIFLRKAVSEEAIPFSVSVKKPVFGVGFTSEEITKAFQEAVQEDLVFSKENGLPVTGYDPVNKRAYIEFADGRREHTND